MEVYIVQPKKFYLYEGIFAGTIHWLHTDVGLICILLAK